MVSVGDTNFDQKFKQLVLALSFGDSALVYGPARRTRFGGFLGMGDKLFAIPWHALVLDADNECFVLDIPKERMEQAPGFNKERWPSMADQRWAADDVRPGELTYVD